MPGERRESLAEVVSLERTQYVTRSLAVPGQFFCSSYVTSIARKALTHRKFASSCRALTDPEFGGRMFPKRCLSELVDIREREIAWDVEAGGSSERH